MLVLSVGVALIVALLLVARHYRRVQYRRELFETALAELHHPNAEERVMGIDTLCTYFRDDEMQTVVPAVIPLLRDEDANVRWAASRGLLGSRTDALWKDERRVAEVLPHLVGAIKDGTAESQEGWSVVMTAIGEPAIPPLIEALRDKRTRQTATNALGHMGVKAVPALIEALQHGGDVRTYAVSALRGIGQPAAEPLLDALQNATDSETRAGAAAALGNVGQGVEGVVPALMAALKNGNEDVKSAANTALVCIGEDARPALLDALEHDAELRSQVASILGRNGPCLSDAVPRLVDLLKNGEDPSVRQNAARVLRQSYGDKIPGLVAQGVPALIDALRDEDPRVRQNAAMALGAIPHDASETVPALVAALRNDASSMVRIRAAWALGDIGPDAQKAVVCLVEALQTDPGAVIRYRAAQALGKIGPDAGEAVAPLISAFQNDKDQLVRANAATALGQIGSSAKEAIPALKEGCRDESPVVQGRCAVALWTLGDRSEEMLPGLQYATKYDSEPQIREAAYTALKEMQDAANSTESAKDRTDAETQEP